MRKPEQKLWDRVKPWMAGLDPVRVENLIGAGTPDVNYLNGWLELKVHDKLPKKVYDVINIPTLKERQEQCAFLAGRWAAGGATFLLLYVEEQNTTFLFSGWDAPDIRRGIDFRSWLNRVLWFHNSRLKYTEDHFKVLHRILRWDLEELEAPLRARLYRIQCRKTILDVHEDSGRKWSLHDIDAAEHRVTPLTNDLIEYWIA